jgi:hypothetical protein
MLLTALIQAILGSISLGRLLAYAQQIRKRITEPPRKRTYQAIPALT